MATFRDAKKTEALLKFSAITRSRNVGVLIKKEERGMVRDRKEPPQTVAQGAKVRETKSLCL